MLAVCGRGSAAGVAHFVPISLTEGAIVSLNGQTVRGNALLYMGLTRLLRVFVVRHAKKHRIMGF